MQGHYERKVVAEYLFNLISSVGPRSPLAKTVTDWIEQDDQFFAITVGLCLIVGGNSFSA